ncbi:MAG TPA: hypothetical protein VGN78_13895 [Solirubrobacteraceae bacterium]|nr:hypothetical protein [Solirubrobacteraceae bacterium]
MVDDRDAAPAKDVLLQSVYAGGHDKPFGELTGEEVRSRADELASAVGFGPTVKVASVARAWSELARRMSDEGAPTVADLGEQAAAELAERLWVVPPGGSLL